MNNIITMLIKNRERIFDVKYLINNKIYNTETSEKIITYIHIRDCLLLHIQNTDIHCIKQKRDNSLYT